MPSEQMNGANYREFLKSFMGIARVLQVLMGAGLWATMAANKYDGPVHFALLVAVLFWLLTVALFLLTLLGKQDAVPVAGGEHWLLSNVVHDAAAVALYLPAIGVLAYKTAKSAYCNLEHYGPPCPYRAYLSATALSGLTACAYFTSTVYASCRKCRGEQTLF
ncbi:MARVEL domain-containing protein 1-like [Brienomyrus brachyistius]|uniref:MARVEL domain-containing protein 1-like n=1 Tax=Brienomyrus brachyistius TaxID=42636 RepID=UPI0020B21395|nr:MARVEL domain-containing protein 1-like [Brienomyrus brachyistius]